MAQSKFKAKETVENGVVASKRRSTMENDHWAFLEEFEAPMWADLSLEPKLMTEDQDESWFHTSHSFHYHSARHLRSAFAHPDVGNDLSNINVQGACSPQLPSSVSKSRGKDYRSKGWRSNCGQVSSNKNHPINDFGCRISIINTVSSRECKPEVSHGNPNEASSLVSGVVDDDDSEKKNGLNSLSTSTNGVSTSTITTVSLQRDIKGLEVPREGGLEVPKEGGHADSLLNALRTNLRKSRATRPASRVEISGDQESKDRKSSSGKSSVGSSSIGYDNEGKGTAAVPKTAQCKQVKIEKNVNTGSRVQNTSFVKSNSDPKLDVRKMKGGSGQNKDGNLNVGDLKKSEKPVNGGVKNKKMVEASVCTRNKAYSSKIKANAAGAPKSNAYNSNLKVNDTATRNNSCTSKIKGNAAAVWNNSYSSKIRSNAAAATYSSKEASKSKKNSLNQSKHGSQGAKGSVGSSQFNKSACSGKENIRGKTFLSQRSDGKDNEPVVRVSDHKVLKLRSKYKVGVTSIGSKERTGMIDDGRMSTDTRIHLR